MDLFAIYLGDGYGRYAAGKFQSSPQARPETSSPPKYPREPKTHKLYNGPANNSLLPAPVMKYAFLVFCIINGREGHGEDIFKYKCKATLGIGAMELNRTQFLSFITFS